VGDLESRDPPESPPIISVHSIKKRHEMQAKAQKVELVLNVSFLRKWAVPSSHDGSD
jgi:hypothetical protein